MTRTIESTKQSQAKRKRFANFVKCDDNAKIERYMEKHGIEIFVDDEPTVHPLYTLKCIDQNIVTSALILLETDEDNPYNLSGERIWIETYKK